jgi:predicted ATP-grasp superfamily ATP-dependent carboligase
MTSLTAARLSTPAAPLAAPLLSPDLPAPFLLTMGGYHGTLAATRCLGAHGVEVSVADPALLAPSRWSRYATRRLSCPPVQEPDRFVDWLLEFGRHFPGHVLYPTGDDVAWLYALRRKELSSVFRMYQPPAETIYTLLNKRRLLQACREAGIETPPTWHAPDDDALARLSPDLPYPILIKPQTQILFWPHAKGSVVRSPGELRAAYERFTRVAKYGPALLARDPEVARPILQAYLPAAVEGIYNLCGFIDETGDLFAVRASRKVLQRPRQLGVGLCFEEAEVHAALAAKLRTLCLQVGYYGAFEAEFVEEGGRSLLIDFNPRFYGQMAFDIARGLPLPLLVHHAALGRRDRLRALVDGAHLEGEPRGRVYCNRVELAMLLRVQRMTGGMSAEEALRWKSWASEHRQSLTDAILDPRDRKPGRAHFASEILHYLRHPRSLLEQLASRI